MMLLTLIPVAAHGLLIAGLAVVLLRLGVSRRRAVAVAFLALGAAAGLVTAWLWPLESCATVNPLGVLLGDWVYAASIQAFGDPNSAQAHYTIPWILRVPQAYALASVALYGAAGAAAQWAWNRAQRNPPAGSEPVGG